MDSLGNLSTWWIDVKAALGMLTRLPVPHDADSVELDLARATRAYPIVGVLIGIAGAAAYLVCDGLGLPPLASALLAVGATALLTGAFHDDGLGDTADGFAGAFERERKLDIMRDSRIGAFGTLALILSVGLRAAALAAIAEPGAVAGALIAAHALARASLPVVMLQIPAARTDGLAAGIGRPEPGHAGAAIVLAALIALFALGLGTGLLALLMGALVAGGFALLARAQIGGYTGDVLGAIEQAVEVAVLLTAAAAL